MAKPRRSADELRLMLMGRLREIPDLAGQKTDIDQPRSVVWMDPGDGGSNWTVRSVTDRRLYRKDIARIVVEMQLRYDLDE